MKPQLARVWPAHDYDRLYGRAGRLGQAGAATYEYDAADNRISLTRNGTTTAYTYDKADRITSAGGAATTVDANGNLTVRGVDTFAYDQANRLTRATVNGQATTFAYDGDGKRTRKVVGAGTADYTYDVATRLPVLLEDGQRRYVRAGGPAYATDASGAGVRHVYHADGLGTVRALTDAAGALTDTLQLDEFGNPSEVAGPSAGLRPWTRAVPPAGRGRPPRRRAPPPRLCASVPRPRVLPCTRPFKGAEGGPVQIDRDAVATSAVPSGLPSRFAPGPPLAAASGIENVETNPPSSWSAIAADRG